MGKYAGTEIFYAGSTCVLLKCRVYILNSMKSGFLASIDDTLLLYLKQRFKEQYLENVRGYKLSWKLCTAMAQCSVKQF